MTHSEDMMLLYVLTAAIFVVFLIGGGIILPLMGIIEDMRDKRPALTPKPPVRLPGQGFERVGSDKDHRSKVAA